MPLGPQETLESGLALPSFHWEPYREHRPQGPEAQRRRQAQRRRVGEPKPSSAYSHRGSSPTRCVPIHSWGEETLGKRTWHRGPRDPEMHGRGWTGMRSGTGHLPSAPLSAPPRLWSWRTSHHRFVPVILTVLPRCIQSRPSSHPLPLKLPAFLKVQLRNLPLKEPLLSSPRPWTPDRDCSLLRTPCTWPVDTALLMTSFY